MSVLQYELVHGPHEEMILTQVSKSGGEIPKTIQDAPQIQFGLELYYGAFMDLVTVRSGMGDGPIPFNAIMDYARAFDFTEDQAEDLAFYVGRLDAAYMDHIRSKTPVNKGSKNGNSREVRTTHPGNR